MTDRGPYGLRSTDLTNHQHSGWLVPGLALPGWLPHVDSNMATSVQQKAMVNGTLQGFKGPPTCLDASRQVGPPGSRALRHHQHSGTLQPS